MELHLNLIEALWLFASTAAGLFTLGNFLEAKEDKEALGPLKNGRLIIANGTLRRNKVRLSKVAIMLAIGFYAALQPGEINNVVGAFGLLLLPAVLAFDSALDAIDNRRLLRFHARPVDRDETSIERQDREVGEERRTRQEADRVAGQ